MHHEVEGEKVVAEENLEINKRIEELSENLFNHLVMNAEATVLVSTLTDIDKNLLAIPDHAPQILIDILKGGGYVPRRLRDYLALMLEKLEPVEAAELVSYLRSSTAKYPDIPPKTREYLVRIVRNRKQAIALWSNEPKNAFLTRSGSFRKEFDDFLATNNLEAFHSSFPKEVVEIRYLPPTDESEVIKLLERYDALYKHQGVDILLLYGDRVLVDDGNFVFGDSYLSCLCAQMALPLGVNIAPSTGSGSIAAVLHINTEDTKYILTNAHVAFNGLSRVDGESKEEAAARERATNLLNNHSFQCSYERGPGQKHMDYAILPCIDSSFDQSLHHYECASLEGDEFAVLDTVLKGHSLRRTFCGTEFFAALWLDLEAGNESPVRVFKRGIATGVTTGFISKYEKETGSFKIRNEFDGCFSRPGDSGSLVFAWEDGRGWYPFGLHYSSTASGESFALPLLEVFRHWQGKNSLQGLEVSFVNPQFPGKKWVKISG